MSRALSLFLTLLVAAIIFSAVPSLNAQSMTSDTQTSTAQTSPNIPTVTAEEALPMTCVQAWTAGGKTIKGLGAIVRTLARVSLANRDLKLPNTKDAGKEVGKAIALDCKADPDALLYAIVDKHVRRVAEAAEK